MKRLLKYSVLVLLFIGAGNCESLATWGPLWRPYSGLNISQNSPQKFTASSADLLKDGTFYYEYPRYIGPKNNLPIASTDGITAVISYQRVCKFLGHTDVVYFEDDITTFATDMLWVQENLLTIKMHNQQIHILICK